MNENNIDWEDWDNEENDEQYYSIRNHGYIIISGSQTDGFSIYDYGLMDYFNSFSKKSSD